MKSPDVTLADPASDPGVQLMMRVRDGDAEAFRELFEKHSRSIVNFAFHFVGNRQRAEEIAQDVFLQIYRAAPRYEPTAKFTTWLYRIATNACLTALEGRSRRPLPTGLGAEASDPLATLVQQPEVPWLQPVPDALVASEAADPATVVTSKESIRLAFVAALQHLPPKQRAVLILRDVLKWRAAEVAELLGTTTTAVNSSLQRAHAQLDRATLVQDEMVEPATPDQRELLDRYVAAFESYDVQAIVDLFTEDAVWEMPPFTGWYLGAETIGRLIGSQCPASGPGDMRMVRADANGQPAFALYMRDLDGVHRAFQLQVLTLTSSGVAHVGCFFDTGLFASFGLPETLPAGGGEPGAGAPRRGGGHGLHAHG